jgi:hypothetical protein
MTTSPSLQLVVGERLDDIHRGRRSGYERTNPVVAISENGQRWLVVPYGEVNWVVNGRTNPRARLSRGRRSEDVQLSELEPKDAILILRAIIAKASIVRPYFNVSLPSSDADFLAEAPSHPVFAISEYAGTRGAPPAGRLHPGR